MKRNKKGFTLVELLAVLIILIIIILIAINIVKKYAQEAEEKRVLADSITYIKAANSLAIELKGSSNEIYTKDLTVSKLNELGIKISGEKPKDGAFIFINNVVTYACVEYDDYYVEFKNNKYSKVKEGKCKKVDYKVNQEIEYTGKEVAITAKVSGLYKLEAWGAQGGNVTNARGGFGGYSYGEITLNKGDKLYVNVGGTGDSALELVEKSLYGGYNGGGNSHSNWQFGFGSGGGATSVAISSGLLKNVAISDLIMVAGGGGGAATKSNSRNSNGGDGGGFMGNRGYDTCPGPGGTQTAGGQGCDTSAHGSYGQGGGADSLIAGGGGGYYGGGSATGWASSAGGGSGYIGNATLTNKGMYCFNCVESPREVDYTVKTTCAEESPTENCAKIGNGYVKLTLISAADNSEFDPADVIDEDEEELFAIRFNGYDRLSYIESHGTEYILAGVKPSDEHGIYVSAAINDSVNGAHNIIGTNGYGGNRYYIGSNYGKLYYGWNAHVDATGFNVTSMCLNGCSISMNYLNDRKIFIGSTSVITNLSTYIFDGLHVQQFAIFANNDRNSIVSYGSFKLYNLKISKGDSVIRNYIPCKSKTDETKIGLCELYTREFYGNNGSGAFTYGELE